ncbi:hypothetical protein SAMN02745866_00324 [Alteromonadaceae bacterium Bs31]|nr:hypothetical protein SAMN02745866_00324 [Alteromonadaceae bacterium Bs31]
MESIKEAQKDMNEGYYYGVPGIVSSGTVWLLAGILALLVEPRIGVATLVFGGTLIFPVSVLLCKALGRTGKHSKGNPLAPLAIEGTIWMLLSIPIAIGAAFTSLNWFFPAMLLVVGGRYLTFNTIYGSRVYWAFGVVLAVSAVSIIALRAPVYIGGLLGGIIEYVFAVIVLVQTKKN